MDTALLVGELALAVGLLGVLCRALCDQVRDLRVQSARRRS
ncbi:MAG: hypothetical protein AB1505_28115 [Candidatus Latescibacterota bacterium]